MRRTLTLSSLVLAVACASPSVRAVETEPERDPPAPDYGEPASWAARPETRDGADVAPPGDRDAQDEAIADVFFVHPTTHFGRAWSAAADDPRAARLLDGVVLPHEAAVFNAAGRVYAPRYRQASLWTFMTRTQRARAARAMELAYSDVRRAFDAWARGSERPVILAAHSQGSYHALRLLADRFEDDAAMRERLVAAYLVGMPLPLDVFERTIPRVPPCEGPEQTGCVLSWNTVLEGARPRRLWRSLPVYYPGSRAWESTAHKRLTCTSPIAAADGWSEPAAHHGALLFADLAARPIEPRVEPALTRARCEGGVLEVERTVPFRYRSDPLGRDGDLHLADYPLFFLDVRRDAVRRVERWQRAR